MWYPVNASGSSDAGDVRLPRGHRWIHVAKGWPGALGLAGAAPLVWALIHFNALDWLSLDYGWFTYLLIAASAVGIGVGCYRRGFHWWVTWGIGIGVTASAVVLATAWWLSADHIVQESYPAIFGLWGWLALWAAGVAVTGWWSGGPAVRVVRLVTAPVAFFTAFVLVQANYGYWPTVASLLNRPAPGQVSSGKLQHDALGSTGLGRTGAIGEYGSVRIPAGTSGFDPGQAYLWLPPAYSKVDHSDIPVMVMLPGWPGNPQNWVKSGQVLGMANAWAHAHGGVAPVMLFIDENGSSGRDTECVNGPQGNSESYLTSEVPAFLQQHYGLSKNPQQWSVAGFSEGGTCAVELGLQHPEVYSHFVDLAGDVAPNWGSARPSEVSLSKLYAGSETAETDHTPLDMLATHKYPSSVGWYSAGRGDPAHMQIEAQLAAASQAAGIDVHSVVMPGGHNWLFAARCFTSIYPQLVAQLESTPDEPGAGPPDDSGPQPTAARPAPNSSPSS